MQLTIGFKCNFIFNTNITFAKVKSKASIFGKQ